MSQPTVEQLIAAGADALRSGERERARRILADAVRTDPRSSQAWLFLAGAVTDEHQRRQCLERVLSLSPGHPAALRGLESLARRSAAPPVAKATPLPQAQPPAPALTVELSVAPPPPLPSDSPSLSPPPQPAANLQLAAGVSLLGRLVPNAATRTTSLASDPDAPSQPATSDTTPLLTLPVETPPPARALDRRLWYGILATGVVLMLIGLSLVAIALL